MPVPKFNTGYHKRINSSGFWVSGPKTSLEVCASGPKTSLEVWASGPKTSLEVWASGPKTSLEVWASGPKTSLKVWATGPKASLEVWASGPKTSLEVTNGAARRATRQNLQVRAVEQPRDTAARRATRQNPQVRAVEQPRDTAARRATRQNPQVRAVEQPRDTEARRATRQEPTEWEKVVAEYELRIQYGPMHRCYSCDRLWFKKQLHKKTRAELKTSNCTDEYINVLVLEQLHNDLEYRFCKRFLQ
ncbi:hypothetical protein Btru_057586 [Bulinus truncatus]|nr:hypothetical protein Btru_057586 [Bulinus truncatus]